MTRLEWLEAKHRDLDKRVTELENQRELERSFTHKTLLIDLKKQRLQVMTEISTLSKDIKAAS